VLSSSPPHPSFFSLFYYLILDLIGDNTSRSKYSSNAKIRLNGDGGIKEVTRKHSDMIGPSCLLFSFLTERERERERVFIQLGCISIFIMLSSFLKE
jgi:hypothetical protein